MTKDEVEEVMARPGRPLVKDMKTGELFIAAEYLDVFIGAVMQPSAILVEHGGTHRHARRLSDFKNLEYLYSI